MLKTLLFFLVVAVLAGLAYIRLAPSDPARWHRPLSFTTPETLPNGARRVVEGDAATLERLDAIIRGTPRTTVLAGSVADGRITYVSRTRLMGYPDYTTVALQDGRILLWGRQRFGGNDWGVNAARIDGWLAALGGA